MILIDPSTPRDEVIGHLDGCASCTALLAFARSRDDLEALAYWRTLLAAHLAAERERRDFGRAVLARLGTYRAPRRENEEVA